MTRWDAEMNLAGRVRLSTFYIIRDYSSTGSE